MRSGLLARIVRVGGVVAVLCAIGVLGAPIARRISCAYTLASATSMAAERPDMLLVRLVSEQPIALAKLHTPSRETIAFTVAAAVRRANADPSRVAQHLAGLASLFNDDPADAVRYFGAAASGSDNAVFWTHLAASQYALAVRENDDEHLLASLGASSRALELDSGRHEASWNFALAAERLGVIPATVELWKRQAALEKSEQWKTEARRRLAAVARQKPAATAWSEAVANGFPDPKDLAHLTAQYPQQARIWGEDVCLGLWADAARNENQLAEIHLSRARIIGQTLLRETGESLLHEAVEAIDHARSSGDAIRARALRDGHSHHSRGRALFRDENLQGAMRELQQAMDCFARGRSPMASLSSAFVATILHDSDRYQDAHDRLIALLAAEDRSGAAHYALRAQLHYQIARIHTIRGYWSDSLAESAEAQALYHRIGERGNEGMAASLAAESYDFIGQPAAAVRNGMRAIRLIAEAGDIYRLRVSSANACRFAMRRGLWDVAHALIRIERTLEQLSPDAVLTSDTLMRTAIIQDRLGRLAAAEHALQAATEEASRVPDAALRSSLIADVHATSGVLWRGRDPARSVALLSSAIEYYSRTNRAILLPQLYLERGRAYLGLNRTMDALGDFERGIGYLERQRTRVRDAGLRYGIFDDAHELFSEAMALRLGSGDPEGAFAVLEHGRARALLEQIAGTSPGEFAGSSLAGVRRAMPPGTLMIEYAVLKDRVVMFLIASDFFDVRSVHIDSATVASKTAAFVESLVLRRTLNEVQSVASDLHALLIAPVAERARYERLVLVPDTALQQIAFAALFDRGRGSFLIEQHLLVTAPSAAVFVEARVRSLREAVRPGEVAVFVCARGDASLALRSLPDADQEAAIVAATYHRSVLIRGAEASVERFISEASRHEIVHFAGHALLDAADPAQSALVMAPRATGEPGFLRCSQIGMTRFHARIVVLAACSTMRGRAGPADGTPSIARSFLAAGVPTVVGTLWDVDDAETASLLTDFHEKLARGQAPAVALRDAQVAALHGQYDPASHPGSWAAYAVLGAGGL